MKKLFTNLLAIPAMVALVLTSCNDPKPEPTPPAIPTIDLAVGVQAETTATIAATVKGAQKIKYTHYEKGKRPTDAAKIEWKEIVTPQDGKFDINYTALTAETEYTAEAYAINATGESAKKTVDFKTTGKPSSLAISEVESGAIAVRFKATYGNDCNGFFYAITPKDKYNEEKFREDCYPVGMGQVMNAVGQESGVHYINQLGAIPAPNTDYVVAAIAAKLNKDGVVEELIGSVVLTDIKTKPLAVNASDVTVLQEVDEAKVSFAKAYAKISRADNNTYGMYHGMLLKSEIAGKTMDQAVIDWLNIKTTSEFGDSYNYQRVSPFMEGQNMFDVEYDLQPATQYVLFTVGYDQTGLLGKVVSKEIISKSVSFDSQATVDAAFVAGITSVDINLTFKNECDKALYVYGANGSYTAESAKAELLLNSTNEYSAHWTPEMTDIKFEYLESDKEYDVYILPIHKSGAFGAIVHKTFKTEAITFESAATVAVEVTKVAFEDATLSFKHTIKITYSNGAAGCEYVTSWADASDTKSAEEHARHMYSNSTVFEKTSEVTLVKGYQESEKYSKVVFVPVDAQGKRGAPVMFTIMNEPKGN